MSVLIFIEESYSPASERNRGLVTLAGTALEELRHDEFQRKFQRLKARFFRQADPDQYPLQGRRLLNRRSLESYRKIEFALELFSLARLSNVKLFAFTQALTAPKSSLWTQAETDQAVVSSSPRTPLLPANYPLLLTHLIERINSFMLECHAGQKAKLVFKTTDGHREQQISGVCRELFYRTPFGGGFHGVLGAAFFLPLAAAPGLQLANLAAYLINQHQTGRRDLSDLYAELESVQFISSFTQDEFEIKGINLLE